MRAEHTTHRFALAQERGIALIAALMIMLLMSALMIGFTTVVMSDQRYRGIDKDRTRAYYGAQSGLEQLSTDLGNLFLANVAPSTSQIAALATTPPSIPGVTFTAPAGVTAYGVTPTLIPCPTTLMATCSAAIGNGPYQGLIALKKLYTLDAVARTSGGGEAHLTRKVESVAIPVFQFGTFSDVDLSFFAGATFNFGGRVHTNGNLFLTAQNGGTTTITDKVTAVGDIIRSRMQNGLTLSTAGFAGTLRMATAPNTFRNYLETEGSLTGGIGSSVNTNWPTISIGTYNGYMRNGGCPTPITCSVPPRGTGAKSLNLALITVGGANTDLSRRPPVNEDITAPVLFEERDFAKVSLRILLSDLPADITTLPTVTATAPVRLGDEGGPGANLTNDWSVAGSQPAGIVVAGTAIPGAGGTMPPIARSPGLQTVTTTGNTASGAATIGVTTAHLTGVYNSPANLRFDILNNLGVLIQTVNCLNVTVTSATQITFGSCLRTNLGVAANLLAVAVNSRIVLTDQNGKTNTYIVNAAVASTSNTTTTRNYTVTSTPALNALVSNHFWMRDNDTSWSVVSCAGLTAPNNIAAGGPWAVTQLSSCANVPQTNAGAGVITTAGLANANVGRIGGYIKIEIQRTDFTWQDVTTEILNWGFADVNQEGTICADPTPNAIIRLQRLQDNGGGAFACTYGASTSGYDYWPHTVFDAREALFRDVAPADVDARLGGVIHYVNVDVANLNKWLRGSAPYGAGSGPQALTMNGYSVYFSDRRNNRADGTNGTTNNAETGEYGFEDVINPLSATGTPNGVLDAGEDVNGNGALDVYGQFPSFLGVRNALLPGALAPANVGTFTPATSIRPSSQISRAAAMTNRAVLFRRALMLTKGTLTSFTTPNVTGLTIVTENPVYVLGDWNWNGTAAVTDPHAATSIIADSVTLLSTAWTDANSFVNPYNADNRVRAANGWYRLAIIAGKGMAFPWPAAGNPGGTFGTDGGAHNFLKYLEQGGGTTNYRGAIATFYYNRQATGTYKFGNTTVYAAPNRAYNFDTDFLDPARLPPLTPVFRDINALGFAQEIRPGK